MGKSLCFQLLPIFSGGLTVVVVPTVALAMDQCLHAAEVFAQMPDVNPQYFASQGGDADPMHVIDLINEGRTRLVFTSPEACVSGRLNSCLDNAARCGVLQNLVVDEAHVVSSWGMYFRVDFQLLSGLRKKWMADAKGELRTFLFTATITPDQKSEVLKLFSDDNSKLKEFCFHSLRPEISYYDRRFSVQNEQKLALEDCLWHLPRPAIVYSTEVEVAEEIYGFVKSLGFRRVGCFTGKTNAIDRKYLLDNWRFDQIDLMVATSAFGLGVDKQDVRTVIHCCLPEDLNRYYQEVGRGGRDGYSAISMLIPTEKDINVAKSMKPKLMSLDLLQERWQSMWETRDEVNSDEHLWTLRLNSKRADLLGDRTYQENIRWNKRLLLQLARAQQIEIQDLSFDAEILKEAGEIQEFLTIKLLDGFNPDSPKMSDSIKEQRAAEATAVGQGFDALTDYLSAERCISIFLRRIFGKDTYRCCGGCRWCRTHDRDPKVAPVFEYDLQNPTTNVRVVENCEHPISGNQRAFVSEVRKLHESGIRRFACRQPVFVKLLELFRIALDNKDLFRLDVVDSGVQLLQPEKLAVFHTEIPTTSSISICGASQVTHILCGELQFHHLRYLLEGTASRVEYFSQLSLLN
jgi:ATP-dependent DNA helicase RecQ